MLSKKNTLVWILNPPTKSRFWIIVPLSFSIFLQVMSGLPRPDLLERIDASKLLVQFSEEVFSYPFWLQDLSHLPLFALFSWLWFWYLKLKENILSSPAFHISWSYACFNELCQFFVPNRFPSLGDLAMNFLGVGLSTLVYAKLTARNIEI
jgi:hypothetical protein